MLRGIKAVLFDFDHTLGVDNKLEFEALHEVAKTYCRHQPSEDEIRTVLDRFRYGAVTLDATLAEALRAWGCAPADVAQGIALFRARSLELAPERVTPMPGASEMLAALAARGLSLGILSNGWTDLQHRKAEIIGFPGPVVASEEIGAWKPELRAFQIALERCGMSAASTLYVGDNPRVDIAGAKAAGMFAAWADFEHARFPEELPSPDLIIYALPELARIA